MFKRKNNGVGGRIKALFSIGPDRDEFYEELEDSLISADIGPRLAMEISDQLRKSGRKLKDGLELRSFVSDFLSGMIHSVNPDPLDDEPACYLFLGVNGVGKTTSMAKLAKRWKDQGRNILFAAGDTFRAAAVEQLSIHAGRLDLRIVKQGQGADPSSVIYDALDSVLSRGSGIVMADSAGRMHNKGQLVKELQKIDKVVGRRLGDRPYKKFLVIDATTGQNGVQQAEVFHQAVGIDAVILSKYDSRARGGLALSISREPGIPFAYLGTGENYGDIQLFDPQNLVDNILDDMDRGKQEPTVKNKNGQ